MKDLDKITKYLGFSDALIAWTYTINAIGVHPHQRFGN
jgi:hypothetical protein